MFLEFSSEYDEIKIYPKQKVDFVEKVNPE
jgi:hypothetical protein